MGKPAYKLSKKEQALIEQYEQQVDDKYRKWWSSIFEESLLYTPKFENYPHEYSINEDTYVYVDFLKPSKHDYVIYDHSEGQVYYTQTVTQVRDQDLKITNKDYNRNVVQREFKKENSVFAPWKMDNTREIVFGLKKDLAKWKVPRFVKDESDYNQVCQIIEDNVIYLKTAYICLISSSNFPAITWNDFTTFVNASKLLDDNLTLSTVDRAFIATKSGGTQDLKDFPERDLSRFEFYEVVVRMAAAKYKDCGKTDTYAEAVKLFIEDNLMTFFNVQKWQEWRETELWTLEVNDVLHANTEPLKKIYKSFHTSK